MTSIESTVSPANLAFVEELYENFLRDASSVSPEWREYFSQVGNGELKLPQPRSGPSFKPASLFNPSGDGSARAPETVALPAHAGVPIGTQDRIYMLIRVYRVRGHRIARIDPLGRIPPTPKELEPEFFGFTEKDMDLPVRSETYQYDGSLTLGQLLQRLRNTYCRSIGVQYMHIDDLSVRRWLQRRMEATENRTQLTRDEQLRILTRLTDAVTFEEFIRKKFVGAKTFSLEGSESLIPLLDLAIEKAGQQGVREIVMGMAHRGRLNVLANIIGKSARQIFREFADTGWKSSPGRGDVKYHLGHSSEWTTSAGKKIQLALCFNPSHLELVNGVALGRARARQDCTGDADHSGSLALLIHGDASFAGEGVVQETLNLSQLPGYRVGGTLHVVVNNQIGFTTGPTEARSTQYATDVAKMLQSPIFHVNGEDPEAVAQVVRLAMDFRHEFKRDVVIDMYGYRRLGHNESDEPTFTQPVLYRAIAERKSVREGYLDHLLRLGEVTREEADEIAEKRREVLEKELSQSQKELSNDGTKFISRAQAADSGNGVHGVPRPAIVGGPEPAGEEMPTGVAREKLAALLESLSRVPEKFHPHPKLKKFLQGREQMAKGELPIDWSAAEALALASVAAQDIRIRMSGQDSERGTFSHRHAVLHDYETGEKYFSLQHLPGNNAVIEIFNSPLSETGVLGFEYGYSLACPDALVLWEAQFGDFWNVAQPIVDQFIASGEDKWQQLSGLALLLPHGFEGAGPEHSSARLERFLWLAAEDNIQVVYPTTPAQFFHCLRRQALRSWRKPVAIMTPKSLLRHPKVISSLDDLSNGSFQRVLPDTTVSAGAVKRVLLCSGKVYYDLAEHREETKREDVAIIRLEQLYPLRRELLERALEGYGAGTPVFWVQEEPANMSAWNFMRIQFGEKLFGRFPFEGISREISATPATGSAKRHKQEQTEIIQRAFGEKE
ncbi:MAG TPA: 2-oxoglutarate dehydrogenase E1 component [Verrucomicrobiae bacterium]|jgi:2-oxoglutarate dehydrogenase E1 component|nr:2-oxoglutarate dehydrogenase E1 component [Verrucomicrobiae bacterium]